MKALVQRVSRAKVTVKGRVVGKIEKGLLVFLGVSESDDKEEITYISDKIINLRLFEDENEKMNLSLLDTKNQILVVSQFTLYGNCEKGRRPSFTEAANPLKAEQIYDEFIKYISIRYEIDVQSGEFGAMMDVELINSGPVTFLLESR